jgi:hypothetical protein
MVIFCCQVNRRNIKVRGMVTHNNISSLPVYRCFIINVKKYSGNNGAAKNDKPPYAIDMLKTALLTRQKILNWPNKQKKQRHTIPVKVCVDLF